MKRRKGFLGSVDSQFTFNDFRKILISTSRDTIASIVFKYNKNSEKVAEISVVGEAREIKGKKLLNLLESNFTISGEESDYDEINVSVTGFSDAGEIIAAVASCCKEDCIFSLVFKRTVRSIANDQEISMFLGRLKDSDNHSSSRRSRRIIDEKPIDYSEEPIDFEIEYGPEDDVPIKSNPRRRR